MLGRVGSTCEYRKTVVGRPAEATEATLRDDGTTGTVGVEFREELLMTELQLDGANGIRPAYCEAIRGDDGCDARGRGA